MEVFYNRNKAVTQRGQAVYEVPCDKRYHDLLQDLLQDLSSRCTVTELKHTNQVPGYE